MDKYHNVPRLNLYYADGSPLPPMYLAYLPPQMLPVQTLNPTSSATGAISTPTAGAKLRRRDFKDGKEFILAAGLAQKNDPTSPYTSARIWAKLDANWVWWIGVVTTGLGGLWYFLL